MGAQLQLRTDSDQEHAPFDVLSSPPNALLRAIRKSSPALDVCNSGRCVGESQGDSRSRKPASWAGLAAKTDTVALVNSTRASIVVTLPLVHYSECYLPGRVRTARSPRVDALWSR